MDTVELLRSLESALRGGYSLRQAVVRAAQDFPDPSLQAVATDAEDGSALDALFDEWAASRPDIGLLAGAVRLQRETGRNLADTLSTLHLVLDRRP